MDHTLTIASWNVLADAYARPDFYPHCPNRALTPGARAEAVAAYVMTLQADLIALQEAEPDLVDLLTSRMPEWHAVWTPKGGGRPDGCLTLVAPGRWTVAMADTLHYDDGPTPSGHVAALLRLTAGQREVTVVNTHLRWAAPGTREHVGVRQARQLCEATADDDHLIVAADINDPLDGPVREELARAGLHGCDHDAPTAAVSGRLRELDVIATRGLVREELEIPTPAAVDIPGAGFPSDHVPLLLTVRL